MFALCVLTLLCLTLIIDSAVFVNLPYHCRIVSAVKLYPSVILTQEILLEEYYHFVYLLINFFIQWTGRFVEVYQGSVYRLHTLMLVPIFTVKTSTWCLHAHYNLLCESQLSLLTAGDLQNTATQVIIFRWKQKVILTKSVFGVLPFGDEEKVIL